MNFKTPHETGIVVTLDSTTQKMKARFKIRLYLHIRLQGYHSNSTYYIKFFFMPDYWSWEFYLRLHSWQLNPTLKAPKKVTLGFMLIIALV